MKSILTMIFLFGTCFAAVALPTGWSATDIGDVSASGSVSTNDSGEIWYVRGSGDGFNSDDECFFVYKQYSGNFELSVNVRRVPASGRVGLMVRESLEDDSRFEMIYLDSQSVVKTDARNSERLYYEPSSDGYSKTVSVKLCMKRYGDEIGNYVEEADPASPGRIKDRATLDGLADTVYVGLVVSSEIDGSILTGKFDSVSLQPLQLDYKTSWLGNTWVGSFKHVQQSAFSMAVHPGNDRFYLGSGFDEGDLFKAMYRLSNGEQISGVEKQSIHKHGGYAVAATTDHVYWANEFDGDHYIFRTNQVGRRSSFANGDYKNHMRFITSQGLIKGMAINEGAGEVYVSNTPEDKVQVYDLEMQHLRTFTVANPESIAVGGSGDLWIVSGHDVLKYTSGGSYTGIQTQKTIGDPRGIAVAPDGSLWVCEFGPKSFILNFNADGSYAGNFGARDGIAADKFGAAPGVVHPLKFNGPVGVGFDGDGNVVVACNSMLDTGENTTEIRKLTQSGNLIWESYGLEWLDVGCPDKTTDGEYFYTDNRKYRLDYSKSDGKEWSYEAYTVDPLNYPEDPRKHERITGSFIRHINGKRFLFVTAMKDDMIVYRFDGEIAVPAFMIRSGNESFPANRPSDSMWKWRDDNANGLFDASEFSSIPDHDYWQWFADDAGDIWSVTKDGKVVHYELTGVDANDVPNYSVSVENDPSEFTQASRCYYDSDNDIMYIGGYTNDNPKPADANEWKQYGREIIGYNNWQSGNRTPDVRIVVPYTAKTASVHDSYVCQNIWVEGDYVFTNISASGEIIAYNKDTGSMVQRFVPGPEVGGRTGLIDLTHGLTAIRRPNGEYIIFQESGDQCKILMFRWTPGESVATQAPYNGSAATIPGKIEVEDYDTGGEGVAYYDTSSGNSGNEYRSEDVDVENCSEGGYNVGWTDDGEWLEYTVDSTAGTYDILLSAASPNSGKSLTVKLGDGPEGTNFTTLGTFDIPDTGGWQNWQTVAMYGVEIPSGSKVVRLEINGGSFNIDWIQFVSITTEAVMLNSGGDAVDGWNSDTGGSTYSTSNSIDRSAVSSPAPEAIYQSERYGDFGYTFSDLSPNSSYTVRIHLAEIYFNASGKRKMDAYVNNSQVLNDYDIYAQAGNSRYKAVVEEVSSTSNSNGEITVDFVGVVDNAKCSGMELVPD